MKNELRFKFASMGAGKSVMLQCQAHALLEQGMIVMIFKPRIDTRDGYDVIKSRTGLQMDCIGIDEDDNLYDIITDEWQYKNVCDKIDSQVWILVDECQFLTPQHVEQLRMLVDTFDHISVVCYGLRTDFNTRLFQGSARLMELADAIEEVELVKYCSCGRKATINARVDENGNIVTNGDQIMVGGDDKYLPMCSRCYHENIP